MEELEPTFQEEDAYQEGITAGKLIEKERILKIIDGRRIECSMKYGKWWMNLESLREAVLDAKDEKEVKK